MIVFFISSAVLVALVLLLLLPVFYRNADTAEPNRTDINVGIAKSQARELKQRLERGEISEEDYADEKARLETGLARDIESEEKQATSAKGQWLLWPVAISIPVAAGALYLALGTPEAFDPNSRVAPPVAQPQQQQQVPDMQAIISRIEQRLEEQPNDAVGWFMLGRAHLSLGDYTQAEGALRRSLELDASNVDVRIRLADAIALTQGRRLDGEPTEILKGVLEDQPNHPQALWLYGTALSQNDEPAEAIVVWQRLLPQLRADPQAVAEIEKLIADANSQLPAAERVVITEQETDTNAAGAGLSVRVDVQEGLADDLSPDTPIFIYAKAANGPPMPLAVVRLSLSELPVTVELTDQQAMIESMTLSSFDEVVVGARISKTGNPIAQSGDLFSESDVVRTKELTSTMILTISGVVP